MHTLWIFYRHREDHEMEYYLVYATEAEVLAFDEADVHPFNFERVENIHDDTWLENVREELSEGITVTG